GRVSELRFVDEGIEVTTLGGGPAGTYSYAYAANPSAGLLGPNGWATRTAETLPDGGQNAVYTNGAGQVMLRRYVATTGLGFGGTREWDRYDRSGGGGRVVRAAAPSAVSGYNDASPDLVPFSIGNAQSRRDAGGLLTKYPHGPAPPATATTAGDALGYLQET